MKLASLRHPWRLARLSTADATQHEPVGHLLLQQHINDLGWPEQQSEVMSVLFLHLQVTHLTQRLQQQMDQGQQLGPKEQLVLRLHEQYPHDVGILSAYFLNYLRLQPGQALYLEVSSLQAVQKAALCCVLSELPL